MICILSPTHNSAVKWAITQNLQSSEWFYGFDHHELKRRTNFHVLVIGEFVEPQLSLFEKLYTLAKAQGQIGRS